MIVKVPGRKVILKRQLDTEIREYESSFTSASMIHDFSLHSINSNDM